MLANLSAAPEQTCRTPCPGLAEQNCGGSVKTVEFKKAEKRQTDGVLYHVTVYQNTAFVSPETDSDAPVPKAEEGSTSAQPAVPDGVETMAGLAPPPAETYGFVTATAVSAQYTTLCNTLMCPAQYLSETATTILVLSTNTQPPPTTLTVPMSTTTVSYDVDDGEGNIVPTSVEFSVPDQYALAEVDNEVEDWIDTQPEANTVLGGKSDEEVDAIADIAGLNGNIDDKQGMAEDGNGQTGSGDSSGAVAGDGGPITERPTLLELERRREEAKRTLMDGLDVEIELGISELHNPHEDGKKRRSSSPFVEATLVESFFEPQIWLDDDADWEPSDGQEEEDEANETDYLTRHIASPDDESSGEDVSDEVMTDDDAPPLPNILDGEDALIGEPILLNPEDNQPISVVEAQKIAHDKRERESDELPIQFEIKLAPDVHQHVKRQSPDQMSAASAPSLSNDMTDGGVRTIGLDSTQPKLLPAPALDFSSAPFPMGNATMVGPTATGRILPLPTTVSDAATGLPTQFIGPKPNMAHPVARSDKFLRYVFVALCLVSIVLYGDELFTT